MFVWLWEESGKKKGDNVGSWTEKGQKRITTMTVNAITIKKIEDCATHKC